MFFFVLYILFTYNITGFSMMANSSPDYEMDELMMLTTMMMMCLPRTVSMYTVSIAYGRRKG